MNRRFRLAALERLRGARLDEAARDLATARRLLADAVATRESVTAGLAAAVPPQRATPGQPALAGAHRDLLRARLVDADRQVVDAEREVARALGGWRCARADRKAVEALHRRHRSAVAAADARAEQRVLDDLAARAARRAGRAGAAR
ncbi:MAG TPA: flagellar FliJ family protein [Kineosporiaceae bacterium]|nr:flagellar FliJ family protein [Kineosporiaceae bacterium]